KRSVITIHDVAFKHMRSVYSLKQYLYLNWSTKYAVRHASKIIVPSEATREDLVNLFNCPEEKIVVIPHGFSKPHVERISFDDCEIFKHYDLDENSKYFFFVGRLESKKNLERLVEAFADFAREHEDYKLVLAGMRGVGFKKIWKRVTDNGLRDKVIMPGYVTSEEKDLLFRHCAGFVFPSLYEGFGFPVLDAFYYGKPVISADTSSLTEVCGKAALLVNPLKSEEIYVAMKRIVEEEGFSELLVTKGLEQLEKFSWEESIKKTLKVLNDGK
ncbi:glycosyltransferase family 4 protein, partial [Patescibacteria group bacterium]|nr:glycosyltransferase family 4 protein [Patescibacteria group bacterium]